MSARDDYPPNVLLMGSAVAYGARLEALWAEIDALRAENAQLGKSVDENIVWDGKQALAENDLLERIKTLVDILEARYTTVEDT